jgi:hypothetical protein
LSRTISAAPRASSESIRSVDDPEAESRPEPRSAVSVERELQRLPHEERGLAARRCRYEITSNSSP